MHIPAKYCYKDHPPNPSVWDFTHSLLPSTKFCFFTPSNTICLFCQAPSHPAKDLSFAMTMSSPSHHSVSLYFSLVNIFYRNSFWAFFLAAIGKIGKEQQNTLIIFPNLCWKHSFIVLPMKSLPVMWQLSITLTNSATTYQPTNPLPCAPRCPCCPLHTPGR